MSKIWKKVFSIIGQTLVWVVILILVAFSLMTTIDRTSDYRTPVFGYRTAAISSESMATVNPANIDIIDIGGKIQKGDCVVAQDVKTIEDLSYHDVILYIGRDGGLVCHRIVDIIIEDDAIIARGDANASLDGKISFSLVRGKVVNVIPHLGTVVLFLQSYYGLLAIFGSMFFITLGILIYSLLNRKSKRIKVVDHHKH